MPTDLPCPAQEQLRHTAGHNGGTGHSEELHHLGHPKQGEDACPCQGQPDRGPKTDAYRKTRLLAPLGNMKKTHCQESFQHALPLMGASLQKRLAWTIPWAGSWSSPGACGRLDRRGRWLGRPAGTPSSLQAVCQLHKIPDVCGDACDVEFQGPYPSPQFPHFQTQGILHHWRVEINRDGHSGTHHLDCKSAPG